MEAIGKVNKNPATSTGTVVVLKKNMGRRAKAVGDARRRTVFEFVMLKGMSMVGTAEALGVHVNTIAADVRRIEKEMREKAGNLDSTSEIGQLMGHYDKIEQIAMIEASAAKAAGAKAMLIGQALRALELKQRLLVETGSVPRAKMEIEGELKLSTGVNVRRMSTEELRNYRETLRQRVFEVN